MLEEKTIQFANFNITFGENEEAMLMHFEDIVFPAFTVLFMYFVAIILSLILKLFLSCMPYDYILTQSDLANSIMAIALLLIYYTFSLRVIYELKSTIYNTVLLFRASLAYKILSFVEENKTSEEKNDDDSD